MKKILLLSFTLLLSVITFSQTKLFLNINDLREPEIKCRLILSMKQDSATFPYYQYLIENDTINDIIYTNGSEKKIELPFNGKIISENVKILYGIAINGVVNKGVFNEKLKMDTDNYFKFRIKKNKIIIEKENIIID